MSMGIKVGYSIFQYVNYRKDWKIPCKGAMSALRQSGGFDAVCNIP